MVCLPIPPRRRTARILLQRGGARGRRRALLPRKLNSFRNVACLAARWWRDILARVLRGVLRGVLGRLLWNGAHDAAATFILRHTMAGSAVRESDRGEKKHRRQHGRTAREEVGRS